MTNEEKAIELANDRKALKKRLLGAKGVLLAEYSKRFTKNRFDFKNKRLVSEDGELALQWTLRRNPTEPPSYKNQQTSVGTVFLLALDKKSVWKYFGSAPDVHICRACGRGAHNIYQHKLNPNIKTHFCNDQCAEIGVKIHGKY